MADRSRNTAGQSATAQATPWIGGLCWLVLLAITVTLAVPVYAQPAKPLLTVRESGVAVLGEGTKAQVKEKAKREAIRRAIERHG